MCQAYIAQYIRHVHYMDMVQCRCSLILCVKHTDMKRYFRTVNVYNTEQKNRPLGTIPVYAELLFRTNIENKYYYR